MAATHSASESEALNFNVPAPIANAVKEAAKKELITKSAYARRAIRAALQRDGFLGEAAAAA
jgi:hypothetical protein